MPSPAAAIAALVMYAAWMGQLGEPIIGPAGFYNAVSLQGVCIYRVEQGWQPGLDCEWDCLAAWGRYEPEMLGQFILADLPGGSYRVCEIVDVRAQEDEAKNGHIVIEVDAGTARECGWTGYVPNVRVWRLGR